MANHCGLRFCKFFRGLIASRRPGEIIELVEKYNKILKNTEASYIDIVIKSQGLLSYQEVMQMPLDSIALFVERLNAAAEEKKLAIEAAKSKRR